MSAAPHLAVVPEPQPEFRKEGLGYLFEPRETGLTFRATYIKRNSDFEVAARVEVTARREGVRPYLIGARYNLSSDTQRKNLAKTLAERSGQAEAVDWRQLVEAFCVRIERAEASGGTFKRIGPQPREARRPDVVERLIPAGKIAMFYGPPGVGKGYLLMALAICMKLGRPFCGLDVQPCEPLYIDMEDDAETFLERVHAVAAGMGIEPPALAWFKPRGLLKHSVHELAQIVDREAIGAAFIDSVGHAGGAPGEHTSYETIAQDLFDTCHAIQQAAPGGSMSWAWIDHVSAAGSHEKLAGKAIGAYRKIMDARVSWEMRKQQDAETDHFTLALYHEKHNHTRKYAPLAIRIEFDNDADGRPRAVRFKRAELHEYADLAGRDEGGLKGRILYALRNGPARTIEQLAEELDADPVSVGARLRELKAAGLARKSENLTGGRGKRALWGAELAPETKGDKGDSPIERDTCQSPLGDGVRYAPSPQKGDTANMTKPDSLSPLTDGGRLPYAEPEDSADFDEEVF